MRFTYTIADNTFEIESLYENIHKMASAYKVDKKGDFVISITQEDIELEKEIAIKSNDYHGESDAYLETLSVLRKLMDVLTPKGYILFHGSLIEIYGKGYLFTAKSGVGKTTHTKLYKKWLGDKVTIVNGDKPILKITDDGVMAYGTPWCGKEGWNTNKSVKLSAICYLNRGETNLIAPIEPENVFPVLYSQTHKTSEILPSVFTLVSKLSSLVKLYRLECNMEDEAARVSFNGMTNPKSFEDLLLLDGTFIYTAVGVSMYPLILEHKDVLTISVKENIEKYDVVLFKRDNGSYVLHRCLAIKGDKYIMCGDNQYKKETIEKRHILGVLTQINRDGTILTMDDPKYIKYVHKTCDHFAWRATKLFFKSLPARIKRKLSRKR